MQSVTKTIKVVIYIELEWRYKDEKEGDVERRVNTLRE